MTSKVKNVIETLKNVDQTKNFYDVANDIYQEIEDDMNELRSREALDERHPTVSDVLANLKHLDPEILLEIGNDDPSDDPEFDEAIDEALLMFIAGNFDLELFDLNLYSGEQLYVLARGLQLDQDIYHYYSPNIDSSYMKECFDWFREEPYEKAAAYAKLIQIRPTSPDQEKYIEEKIQSLT